MAQISDLQKGLVGHWTMNSEDVDNGTVRDKSGYDNHGTTYQNASFGVSGIVGDSASFVGEGGGFVRTPAQDTFSSYTVSFWIFTHSLNNGGHVISTFQNNSIQFRTRGGGLNFRQDDSSGNVAKIGGSPDPKKWYHVAGSWNGSQIELFIDGSSSGTQSISNMNVPGSGSGFQIGKHAYGADRGVWAKMSDVRLYNRALSQPEIQQLTNQRTSPVMSVGGIDTSNVTAGGGNEYTKTLADGDYTVHEFTSDGTFSVSEGGNVDVLVVGGGGAGGADQGGGGGAGGVIYKSLSISPTTYSITVGSGGTGSLSNGSSGSDSSAFGLTAIGGGGGAHWNGSSGGNSLDGGSGGGEAGSGSNTGSSGLQPSSTDGGFGNDGGDNTERGGAGGGGASTKGDVSVNEGANGGDGLYFGDAFSEDFGENGYFAGGGGGGHNTGGNSGGSGGIGGGADSTSTDADPNPDNDATDSTGGGGAGGTGSGGAAGGDGGSGIVLIRYKN